MPGMLVTDPSEVERLAEKRADENWGFRAYIKGLGWPGERLDSVVHEICAAVTAEIDCGACANCCKVLGCELADSEIRRLARRSGMGTSEFEERYVTVDEFRQKGIHTKPCPFLAGNRCSVYEDRPADCKGYPHLDQPDFRFRTIGTIENAPVCPIVFNTLERLKERLPWHARRRRRGRYGY